VLYLIDCHTQVDVDILEVAALTFCVTYPKKTLCSDSPGFS